MTTGDTLQPAMGRTTLSLLLICIICICPLVMAQGFDIEAGGNLGTHHTLTLWDSPYTIREDLIVSGNATLTVDPGVELRFAPGVMLAINGTLIAKGTKSSRILMTKVPEPEDAAPQWPDDIRLVDDRSVMYGRLQLLYQGKWRGICANSINWTQSDTDVACRQLGFETGNFSFFSWATNESMFMLYHQPGCVGSENHVLQCPGASRIKIGSRICRNQQTIHLHCYGMVAQSPASNFWWGLEFYNASTKLYSLGDAVWITESTSVLEFVDLEYAGVSPLGEPVPAIRASPTVPYITNVTVRHCALDGTNFTDIMGSTVVRHSLIENNRGHGLSVETHLGRVSIMDSTVQKNMGNGIKTKFLDGRYRIYNEDLTFCRRVNHPGPSNFPLLITGIPNEDAVNGCGKKFETTVTQQVTLNFLEMDIEPAATGTLTVYDAQSPEFDRKMATYDIVNGTLPAGITSTFHYMYVEFKWTKPPNCPTLWDCVKVTILVDTAKASKAEAYVNNTMVLNNTQHGIYFENVRNYVFVNASDVSHNAYGAGVRVFGGAGDVHINASTVDYNQDNGVNITYDGGWRIFNESSFSNNLGNGVNVTLNETRVDNKTRYARQQRLEVWRSNFTLNEKFGLRVGNCCSPGLAVVNNSRFILNGGDAIEMESCYKTLPLANATNFTVGYNEFRANYGHAVKISPMINVVGRIANNTFDDHPRHTLLIDNTDDFLLSQAYAEMHVKYEVMGNTFRGNKGFYVAHVRLTQGSNRQEMKFQYNILTDNAIEGAFPTLNERTRAYGVVVVSSSNIELTRNHLTNPASRFELTTHLLDQSVKLQTIHQWWNTTEYEDILPKIFDQFSRYDLPRLEYHPCLLDDDLYSDRFTTLQRPLEPDFNREDTLGGRLTEEFKTQAGKTYRVDRDINIVADQGNSGKLVLSPGTVLLFENAIGMLVQGELQSGQAGDIVVLQLKNETTYRNHTLLRIVDGPDELEGRLEVRPTEADEWGTVCKEGWTIRDASVACQMLGWVVHPDDWGQYESLPGPESQTIWRSSVTCEELDMDLTKCAADGPLDHSCNHTHDVYVRCKPPTWAGVRFLAKAKASAMKHMRLSGAGLRDPTLYAYAPAIRVDYNTHTLEHLEVTDNQHDGIEIMKNDIYPMVALRHSHVSNNLGNGLATRGSFFEVYNCTFSGNKKAGFEYNPHYTTYEARQIRVGILDPLVFSQADMAVSLANEERMFVVTQPELDVGQRVYKLQVTAHSQHRVILDLIDYNPQTWQENVTVFDSHAINIQPHTRRWVIEDDLVDFPIESSATALTVRWAVNGASSGRLTFVLRSKPFSWPWPFARVHVKNTTTVGNDHGIVTRHYNQPSNEYLDLFFRFRWETISMYGVTFRGSRFEALHVPSITKYNELYQPTFEELQSPSKLAEINYELEACLFTENNGGVLAEHNHVEFSNNVWIWEVTHNRFERNTAGGFDIELPKVNLMSSELYNHSVDVNDTIFEYNDKFEFRIDGFYCNSSIARNRFQGNNCKLGCISITGTEKDFEMHENEIVENVGRYMVELNMNSHTPYTRWVDARIEYNNFKRNEKPDDGMPPSASSSPDSYTLGVKGLQNITINRNLFHNYLDFEVLGGYASSSLENYLDVTENWWGTTQQEEIRAKVFDFDDWNSYAIAEYFPYLMGDSFDAPKSTGEKWEPEFDPNQPLGGRIVDDLRLYTRAEPYVVKSDLTIMPTASMFIEKGVTLEFYPNVGILVLGSLSARGTADKRIKFSPIAREELQALDGQTARRMRRGVAKRASGSLHDHGGGTLDPRALNAMTVRLNGGDHPYEGFLELYNETEGRWTLVCDSNFNERTAEVACRTMGMESSNAIVRRTPYYDIFVLGYPKMHDQLLEWFWRRTFICDGTEATLEQCRYKVNYNLRTCMDAKQYVFARCGPRNLAPEYDYWGNVRYSSPEFEDSDITAGYAHLEYLDVYGAGILHGEKVAAIQSIHRTPSTEHVRVTHCNHNGYDYIAPRGEFEVTRSEVYSNNGYAFGGLVLNGESNYDESLSSFLPLVHSTIPYNVFGLVRMCTSEKLIYVKTRLLVYYKYHFETIDCIKVFRSAEPRKRIGLRFLQLNLYNDTFYENAVEMYDGEYFSPDMMVGKMTAGSSAEYRRRKYETSAAYDTMGIRVTASAAYGDLGFIAEVVTLPYSPNWQPDLGAGLKQRISHSVITDNEGGGFNFANVGELNPAILIESNRIQRCGLKLLNMTSAPMISGYIQNSLLATIANNYMVGNAGGVELNTTTPALRTAIYINITNNVINYNTHGEPLHIEGHYFQGIEVKNNYIAFNDVQIRNVVSMFGIRSNFSTNIIYNNTGRCILNASVPEQIDINQRYIQNSFYDNQAYAENRSTLFLKSAKFSFRDNYFQNPWNIFEMVTFNRTKYPDGTYPSVDAVSNWWGGGSASFVGGRVWDRRDDDNLIRIEFDPFHTSNQSVIQGRCYPGWRMYDNKCYWYFGGVVSYRDAELECKASRGRLAWARDGYMEEYFGEIVSSMQDNYDEWWQTWVYSEWQEEGRCTVLQNYKIEHTDCAENLPFICERDPYIQPKTNWRPVIISFSTIGAVTIVILILLIFALLKSKARKKERLHRRTDMRKSIRGSRASVFTNRTGGTARAAAADEAQQAKKRRPPMRPGMDNSFIDLSGVTLDETADDSYDKVKLDFHRPGTPASMLDSSSHSKFDSSYFDSDLGPTQREPRDYQDFRPPRLENEISHMRPPNAFEQVYRNEAYDDEKSLDRGGRYKSASSMGSPPRARRQYPREPYSPGAYSGHSGYSGQGAFAGQGAAVGPQGTYGGGGQGGRGAYGGGQGGAGAGAYSGQGGYGASRGPALGAPSTDSSSHQGYVKPPRPRPKESAM